MAVPIRRVQFLRGDVRGERAPIRPPWALPEALFTDVCTRCGKCIDSCPERVLLEGRGGFPQVDFARGECTFCGDCVQLCQDGALRREVNTAAWTLKPRFTERCLARNGVVCMTCAEQCEASAVEFVSTVGKAAQPRLDDQKCTGCGACFDPCPSNAVLMVYQNLEQ